ncbi:SDR family NAD(P)-dependent oxidoreductase [Paenibacillus sepulcri]|uniref:SDR family NAD(P)-dependent oxidoreductase n=1 Tax=Paenibacillus sepulcri TaxID=359917 RepID=A0ABS7C3C2_9BACL|nr:SDR family NAD(P)-dependent oxidoreductase [Paenibacillus sepulcri]
MGSREDGDVTFEPGKAVICYANSAPIEEMEGEDFRTQIETNLFGVVNVTRAALPMLRKQRSGHFIQFSPLPPHQKSPTSHGGFFGMPETIITMKQFSCKNSC